MMSFPTPAHRISVLIPALNEEESVALVIKDLPKDLVQRIIVIDNGSIDRTSEVARRTNAQVVCEHRRGYGSACLAGIAALPQDAEIVVFIDADYSDFPEELSLLVGPLLEGRADLVLGTRMHSPQSRAALTPQQRWGNCLAVGLMRWFWGCDYSDLGPFRAIRRSSLERLAMCDRNFGWTVEMQIKATLLGLKTVEVPVRYRKRIGHSKVSGTAKGVVLAGTKILFTIFYQAWCTRRHFRRTKWGSV